MDHRRDVCAVALANGAQSVPYALLGRDLDRDVPAARRWASGCLAVEADDVRKASGEPPDHSISDPPAGAADLELNARPHLAAPNVIPVGSSPTLKVRATVWSATLISATVSAKRFETNTRLPSLVATTP